MKTVDATSYIKLLLDCVQSLPMIMKTSQTNEFL